MALLIHTCEYLAGLLLCDSEAVSHIIPVNCHRFRYLNMHLGNLQEDVQGKTGEMLVFHSQIIKSQCGCGGEMQMLSSICMHRGENKRENRVEWFSFSFSLTGQEERRRGGLKNGPRR